jgi:AAA domain
VGEDSVLGQLTKGHIEPTPMYQALDDYMSEFKPSLTILDVLADMFAGDENSRPQARQFIGLLKRLARKHCCAFLQVNQGQCPLCFTSGLLSDSFRTVMIAVKFLALEKLNFTNPFWNSNYVAVTESLTLMISCRFGRRGYEISSLHWASTSDWHYWRGIPYVRACL